MMSTGSNINLNSKWRTTAMLENIRNAITLLPMDQLERNLRGRMPSCSRRFRHVAVAMATAVRRIEHSAVMVVWRPST